MRNGLADVVVHDGCVRLEISGAFVLTPSGEGTRERWVEGDGGGSGREESSLAEESSQFEMKDSERNPFLPPCGEDPAPLP